MPPAVLIVVGLLLLAAGGELLVRGATAVARQVGVTPAVIGLTIVAIGTSLPELVVSFLAARAGQQDIAVGNIVGSNIFNILGVLGITALIAVIPVEGTAVKVEWPFMFLASCAVVVFARDGIIDRLEGGLMLAAYVVFTVFMIRLARQAVFGAEREAFERAIVGRTLWTTAAAAGLSVAAIVAGLALLGGGGRLLVTGAIDLARMAGLSERVIGLTIVAVGTSTPEIAASVVAALRGRTDVAVANVIGSNIFNILGILGGTALYRPLAVSAAMLNTDMVWMMVAALALFPILRSGMQVARSEGLLLLGSYAAYLILLLR
ncbi:MAG: calcium/sodium antiporter [Gemmatimonadota bacterium]